MSLTMALAASFGLMSLPRYQQFFGEATSCLRLMHPLYVTRTQRGPLLTFAPGWNWLTELKRWLTVDVGQEIGRQSSPLAVRRNCVR